MSYCPECAKLERENLANATAYCETEAELTKVRDREKRLRAALEAALTAVELVRSQFSGGSDLTIDQMVSALNGALAQARVALKE